MILCSLNMLRLCFSEVEFCVLFLYVLWEFILNNLLLEQQNEVAFPKTLVRKMQREQKLSNVNMFSKYMPPQIGNSIACSGKEHLNLWIKNSSGALDLDG